MGETPDTVPNANSVVPVVSPVALATETANHTGNVAPAPQPAKPEQKPFTCYKRSKGKSWIVDGVPLTPITKKNGEVALGTRVQETWPNQLAAESRKKEINDILAGKRIIPTVQSNLNPEQINAAEKFFLTRQCTVAQLDAAMDMFSALFRLKHTDWTPEKLVEHGEATGYREDNTIPPIPEALDRYVAAQTKGGEGRRRVREATSKNVMWVIALLKESFKDIRADQFTDDVAREWIDAGTTLKREKITIHQSMVDGQMVESVTRTIVESKTKRPWEIPTNNFVRVRVAAIRNWFAKQGWGTRSKIEQIPEPNEMILEREARLRVLTTEEKQKIMDNAYAYKPKGKKAGYYAAHFVQRLLGGCRKSDTERFDPAGFNEVEGHTRQSRATTKNHKFRQSTCMPIYTLLMSELKNRGMFERANLNPPKTAIEHIFALSGFAYKSAHYAHLKESMIKSKCYPQNGLRRSAMAAHFQVTESASDTTSWAGTTSGEWDEWYSRAYSKQEAREHWQQLVPTFMRVTMTEEDFLALLPSGHKLDNVVNQELARLIDRTKVVGEEFSSGEAEDEESLASARREDRKEYLISYHEAHPEVRKKAHDTFQKKNRQLADETGMPCVTSEQRKLAAEQRRHLLPEQVAANLKRAQEERLKRAASIALTPEQRQLAKNAAQQARIAALTPEQRAQRNALRAAAQRRRVAALKGTPQSSLPS
jgi:hypothetical protein